MVVEALGIHGLQRRADSFVKYSAAFIQYRSVGDRMSERVFEDVLDIAKCGLLVDELAELEFRQYRLQLRSRLGGHLADQTEFEFGADHGQRLEQVFLIRRQPVYARGENRLYGRRNLELVHWPGELGGPIAHQRPSSSNTSTVSSIKNGLPSVFSMIRRLSGGISGPSPSNAVSISSALSLPSGSRRNCV